MNKNQCKKKYMFYGRDKTKATQICTAISNVKKDISRTKTKLSRRKKASIRENFGQNDIRRIRGKIDNIDVSHPDKKQLFNLLDKLDRFAMTFGGK